MTIRSPWHNAPDEMPPLPPKKEPETVEVRVWHENPAAAVADFRKALEQAGEIRDEMNAACDRFGEKADQYVKALSRWRMFTLVNLVVFSIYIGLSLFTIFYH